MWRWLLIGVLVIGAGVLGRVTASEPDDYGAGLRDGRALQVAPDARDAFEAGYAAGANDVFSGYDGGWDYDRPYVITLEKGENGITYRISSRAGQRR
jgi:hypothetical protein